MTQYPGGDDMDDPFLGIHNPTVYLSSAEMKAMENEIPFCDDDYNEENETDEF